MILPFKIDVSSLPCIDDNRGRSKTIIDFPVIIGIYRITSPKGAIYIGLSNDIYYRTYSCYKKLRCKQQKKIYNSLKKYEIRNHTFEIIHIIEKGELTNSDIRKELNRLETHYIKFFNSFCGDNDEFGLNLTRGGDSMELTEESRKAIGNKNRGKKRSKESIEKTRIANTGRIASVETRKKQSDARIGKKTSTETRKKQSDAHKGEKHSKERTQKKIGIKQSPEQIAKRVKKISGKNHWLYGKKHTEETKQKIKDNLTGRFVGEKNPSFGKPKSEKTKELIRNKKIGVKRSEEAKRKHSESIMGEKHHHFGKKASDELRKKLSDAHKGTKQSKETIEKKVIIMKLYWEGVKNGTIKRKKKT